VKTSSISVPVGGSETTIRFDSPSDGFVDVGTGGALERIYLGLSNRRANGTLVVEKGGKRPVRSIIPVGKQTMLQNTHD